MAQIQPPVTYANGQTVDAPAFNNHVAGATLLPGCITEQAVLYTGEVHPLDSILIYDNSAMGLKKASLQDALGSNINISTSVITSPSSNIGITPGSGLLNVTGNLAVQGGLVTTGGISVGSGQFSGDLNVTGTNAYLPATAITGAALVTENLIVGGTISATNFNDKLLLYGVESYDLIDLTGIGVSTNTDISIVTPPTFYTTPTLTKPAGEIWVFEFSGSCLWGNAGSGKGADAVFKLTNASSEAVYYTVFRNNNADVMSGSDARKTMQHVYFRHVSPTSETFIAGISLKCGTNATNNQNGSAYRMVVGKSTAIGTDISPTGLTMTPGKLTIFKYKNG